MNSADRILLVCTQMEAAGVQRLATEMADRLRQGGTEATTAFLYVKRPVFALSSDIVAFSPVRPRGIADLVAIVFRLFVFVRRYRPTAVIGFAHYSSPLTALAGFLGGVPVRIGTQTNPPQSYGRLARWLDVLCGTLGLYTHNVAASHSIAKMFSGYSKHYRARLVAIPNGVTLPPPTMSRSEARSAFGVPDKFILMNCGRLADQKNQRFLLPLLERIPDAHLVMVGEGELRAALEAEVMARALGDRVTLVGEIDPRKMPDILQCADVFVFPSLYEAFGLALVEAMAAGLPVVASDSPALVEVVGNAGYTLPLCDMDRWVAAIEQLRTSAVRREEAATAAHARAEEFSFDRMMRAYGDLWER